MEDERVGALGVLHSLRSKMKLSAAKRWEMHSLSNTETEKWIEDYVNRVTSVARNRVPDAETASMQEQEHMRNVEKVWWTTTKPETTFEVMVNAIGDTLSDCASSEDDEDGEVVDDDEEDTELRKLSEDDEPGWMKGTISKSVQRRMESFRQNPMRIDELTQPGWEDMAEYLRQRDMNHGTTELEVLAVVKPQTDTTAATPSPTTFGVTTQVLDIVPGQSEMSTMTSRQGSGNIRVGLETPQEDNHLVSLISNAVPNSLQMDIATPVQSFSFYHSV